MPEAQPKTRAKLPSTQASSVPERLLARFSEYITAHMGLHFPRKRWSSLEQGICRASKEFGFSDAESCISWIMSYPLTREQIETLSSFLTVGETYFWREYKTIVALETDIIPELVRTRPAGERHLRIWSAGCSSGEEPYSIAILLDGMGKMLREWNITIIATDINTRALLKATEGIYREWSFRNVPPWFKEKYFTSTANGCYELIPRIRSMVDFSYLNLAEDTYPSLATNTNAMDVIFCRNVLMYLTPEVANRVVERFNNSLVDGGWLVVSPAEVPHVQHSGFRMVGFTDAILYRKQEPEATAVSGIAFQVSSSGVQPERRPLPLPPPVAPPPPPSPYEAAFSLYESGAYDEAAERLSSHLAEKEGDARALALMCRIRANQGKLAEALELSEHAIAADRQSAGLHYLRAVILQEQGTNDQAAASLKRALYLSPDFVLAHFALGNLSLREGKPKESKRHFDNALSLLRKYRDDEPIPESEGMLAGRMMEIIREIGEK